MPLPEGYPLLGHGTASRASTAVGGSASPSRFAAGLRQDSASARRDPSPVARLRRLTGPAEVKRVQPASSSCIERETPRAAPRDRRSWTTRWGDLAQSTLAGDNARDLPSFRRPCSFSGWGWARSCCSGASTGWWLRSRPRRPSASSQTLCDVAARVLAWSAASSAGAASLP